MTRFFCLLLTTGMSEKYLTECGTYLLTTQTVGVKIRPDFLLRPMEQTTASASLFRFGIFEADSGNYTLTRSGARVKIQEQPFRLLVLLLERPGEIVSREELRQRLWPEGTYVDFDGSLNVLLKRLRATIGDDPENPRFVETVPRRGYRFIAPVVVVPPKFGQAPAKVPENGSQQVSPPPASPPALSGPISQALAAKTGKQAVD